MLDLGRHTWTSPCRRSWSPTSQSAARSCSGLLGWVRTISPPTVPRNCSLALQCCYRVTRSGCYEPRAWWLEEYFWRDWGFCKSFIKRHSAVLLYSTIPCCIQFTKCKFITHVGSDSTIFLWNTRYIPSLLPPSLTWGNAGGKGPGSSQIVSKFWKMLAVQRLPRGVNIFPGIQGTSKWWQNDQNGHTWIYRY